MDQQRKEFETSLSALVEDARRHLRRHPLPEDLIAYHTGELSPEESEPIQEHLTFCRDCAAYLLEFASFPASGESDSTTRTTRTPDQEPGEAWEALQSRLGRGRKSSITFIATWLRQLSEPVAPLGWLSAALCLITVGLGWWSISSNLALEALAGPQINVGVQSLRPRVDPNRGGTDAATIMEADSTILILTLLDQRTFSDYSMEILDAAQEDAFPIWSSRGLRKTRNGTFHIQLPPESLSPGIYEIHLYGIDPAGLRLLAKYDLIIDRETP